MGPDAQPYDFYITVRDEPLVPPVTIDTTWLDGPVGVTGWCMKKKTVNPGPIDATAVLEGAPQSQEACVDENRECICVCVLLFILVFGWHMLNFECFHSFF